MTRIYAPNYLHSPTQFHRIFYWDIVTTLLSPFLFYVYERQIKFIHYSIYRRGVYAYVSFVCHNSTVSAFFSVQSVRCSVCSLLSQQVRRELWRFKEPKGTGNLYCDRKSSRWRSYKDAQTADWIERQDIFLAFRSFFHPELGAYLLFERQIDREPASLPPFSEAKQRKTILTIKKMGFAWFLLRFIDIELKNNRRQMQFWTLI